MEKIEQIIEQLVSNGSTFDSESLKRIKQVVETEIKKDQSIEDCLKDLTVELENCSSQFLHHTDEIVSGLSSCIYLPNPDGSYSLTVFGGKTAYDENGKEISEKTIFDIASITKLYTFILTSKLIEQGFLKKTDKISELDSRFTALDDYTVEDIFKMAGEIRTDGRVTDGKNYEEAFKILQTTYVANKDRSFNNYTDLGFVVLSKVLEKIVSEKLGKEIKFDEIMNEYLLKPWNLEGTVFHPNKEVYDIAGNGNQEGLVHDPKARLLGGAVGAAGLFATSESLKKLADHLFAVQNVNYSKLAGTIIYPESKQCHKGIAGLYQKHPMGLDKTYVPNEYATGSFAHQGFTGAIAVFDPTNKIHNNILVNAIKEGEAKKPDGFLDVNEVYQMMVTEVTMKAYLLNQYYSMIGYNEDVTLEGRVR